MSYKVKFLTIFFGILLISCHAQSDQNTVILGTIAGPETALAEEAKNVAAKKYNLTIKIKTFNDYSEPNRALNEGVLDANMFQHLAYLEMATKNFGYKFSVIGKTFIYPMGLYSKKITKLTDLTTGAIVVIPNDPSNEARALLLLQQADLMKLKLKIEKVDAAMIPRLLDDASLAAINSNYALMAGLSPSKNALFIESKDSPYANIVVVQEKDKNEDKFKRLMQALNSPEVAVKAQELFHGEAIPTW